MWNKMFTELASQRIYCYACCVACGTVLLKPHVVQVKLLHFGYSSTQHSQLRNNSQHLWRNTVQWCHQPINRTKLWLFLDALVGFAMLLADLYSKSNNSAYLRIHWAKNDLRRWTQFFDKEVDLRPNFQEKFNDLQALFVWKTIHG